MRVMISQPMRGKTNKQIKEERKSLVKLLTKQYGWEVIDTIIYEKPPKEADEAIYYLSKSVEFISKVDCVFFMKGWEKARGCKIEHQIAVNYDKEIIYEN